MINFSRQIAFEIFSAGVESVKPDILLNHKVSVDNNILWIEKNTFNFSDIKNLYVIGAGKASAAMARAIEAKFGNRITAGHIVTKYGHSMPLRFIGITEGGHPVPDENGIRGTEKILSILNKAEDNDLVICLISGGGSALLADMPEECTLEELEAVNSILLQAGANITEINCIRKHLSKVKGGLLAKAAIPARVMSLILSDVIGDALEVIASGPTVPDPTTYADAISILHKYKIENKIPKQIYRVLKEGFEGNRDETLKERDEVFLRTDNLIIGNNSLALEAAKNKAESFGYQTHIINNCLEGDIWDVANYIVKAAINAKKQNGKKKKCLLFGGEPTVKVTGEGQGGRNQHLALIMAKLLKGEPEITFLSGGTDGSDGNTDAAGGVVDSYTSANASKMGLSIEQYISNFDSYNFFKQEGGLIVTGPTQTNVMDLMVTLIDF